ncbi:thiamine phosphate synthase [Hoeflea prorocentri]|uniref:Thiamine-phosphate synthase n=1 Tax=Hoeflea prorocentri TaxID=1922333 RepID=A0A9X3UID7_9HYPH|nr:thiamine phosphate synthase [Hoeflea prorocentri]MCY6381161.1 thiamine phosphate synthase [Hoeflea prorocentri]MDA5398961.1 thiamine phosphate synthase [Hoeflea prorocentri]
MKLDPFYLVVDNAEWIARLVPLGVRLVQLRMKNMSEADMRRDIAAAKQVCGDHGCQLILNDYWRLAIEEGCDYIHLGQEDLAGADVSAIRAAGIRVGVSTHDSRELKAALAVQPNYVALGPVYETRLKKMPWRPQGCDRIRDWKQRIGDIPLVAIGGLDPSRLHGVFDAGADIAAVVTDIVTNDNPQARTLEWIRTTRRWAKKTL